MIGHNSILLILFSVLSHHVFAQGSRLGELDSLHVLALLDEAETAKLRGSYDESNILLDSASVIVEKFDNPLFEANILTQLGVLRIYQGNHSEALDYLLQGMSLRQVDGDSVLLSESFNLIATVHLYQKNLARAAGYYSFALDYLGESSDLRQRGLILNNLGSLYEDINDIDSALYYHNQSIEIWEEIQDSAWIAISLLHIGNCYKEQGELKRAQNALQKAYEIAKEHGSRISAFVATHSLGLVELQETNYSKALEWCTVSYGLAREENHLVAIKEASECLAEAHELTGDHEAALRFYKRATEIQDSIFGKEKTKEITELELNFQFEKEQLADSLEFVRTSLIQEKKISNQRIGLFSTGVITLIMILLAFVVYQGKQRSEKLLLNILPSEVATELKNTGAAKARRFDNVTVIFTDFKGFTEMSEKLSAESLVSEINLCFSEFDSIMTKYGIEKIKTIGDAYMAVSGLPISEEKHAQLAVSAALEMVEFMKHRKEDLEKEGKLGFEMRVGIHSGDVVAGIVGTKKFQYDIWGDTVNTAARMESMGKVSKVNISDTTHQLVKDEFLCTPRGELKVKGKGMVNMFFVDAVNQSGGNSVS